MGLVERVRRHRRQIQKQMQEELVREGEVGECSECHNIYPWNKLTDFSTQTYYLVLCPRCIASHDPRYRGQ